MIGSLGAKDFSLWRGQLYPSLYNHNLTIEVCSSGYLGKRVKTTPRFIGDVQILQKLVIIQSLQILKEDSGINGLLYLMQLP